MSYPAPDGGRCSNPLLIQMALAYPDGNKKKEGSSKWGPAAQFQTRLWVWLSPNHFTVSDGSFLTCENEGGGLTSSNFPAARGPNTSGYIWFNSFTGVHRALFRPKILKITATMINRFCSESSLVNQFFETGNIFLQRNNVIRDCWVSMSTHKSPLNCKVPAYSTTVRTPLLAGTQGE